MQSTHPYRNQKIETAITQALGEAIIKKIVADPRVHPLITICSTSLAHDRRSATVSVSGVISKTAMRKSIKGLNSAAGFLQAYIGKTLALRFTPRLRFVYNDALQQGFELVQYFEGKYSTRVDTPT